MNMPDDLVLDFFTRTIKNLKLYDKYCKEESTKKEFKYEVTQLVNSFLGLIVFIVEKSKKDLKKEFHQSI